MGMVFYTMIMGDEVRIRAMLWPVGQQWARTDDRFYVSVLYVMGCTVAHWYFELLFLCAEQLTQYFAQCVSRYVKQHPVEGELNLVYQVNFPCRHNALNATEVTRWTKECYLYGLRYAEILQMLENVNKLVKVTYTHFNERWYNSQQIKM